MIWTRLHPSRASSTFESLIALAVCSTILAGLGFSLKSSLATRIVVEKERWETGLYQKVSEELRQAADNLDSHRFNLPLRIHPQGAITFTDGSPNPVTTRRDLIAPAPNSDALTTLRLDLLNSWEVVLAEKNGPGAKYIACPRYYQKITPENDKGFIGVGVDGLIELHGELSKHPGRPECLDMVMQRSLSMTVPHSDEISVLSMRVIIPIAAHYTLYLDRAGQLRHLGHRGLKNIENQPLLAGLKRLSLQEAAVLNSRILLLDGAMVSSSEWEHHFSFNNHLGRSAPFNFLFNRG